MQERAKVAAMLVPPTIDTEATLLASEFETEDVEAADRERMLKVWMLYYMYMHTYIRTYPDFRSWRG
jgi:hypothetical protein